MRKYWRLIMQCAMNALEDRARVFVWNLLDLVPTLISLGLWIGIYRWSGKFTSGWSLEHLVTYFLLTNLLTLILSINIENAIYNDHIMKGELATILVKPINYFSYLFCIEHGWKITRLSIALPTTLLLFAAFFHYIQIPLVLSDIAWFLFFLVIALPMFFYWKLIVGFFSFWTLENWGLMNFFWMTQALFSGSLFPLHFMGKFLGTVAAFLPFQYFYFVPITALLENNSLSQRGLQAIVAVAWLLILRTIAGYMYRKGVVRFTDTMQ